jgi:hypothetical protein
MLAPLVYFLAPAWNHQWPISQWNYPSTRPKITRGFPNAFPCSKDITNLTHTPYHNIQEKYLTEVSEKPLAEKLGLLVDTYEKVGTGKK